jgi:hypothetical protein
MFFKVILEFIAFYSKLFEKNYFRHQKSTTNFATYKFSQIVKKSI